MSWANSGLCHFQKTKIDQKPSSKCIFGFCMLITFFSSIIFHIQHSNSPNLLAFFVHVRKTEIFFVLITSRIYFFVFHCVPNVNNCVLLNEQLQYFLLFFVSSFRFQVALKVQAVVPDLETSYLLNKPLQYFFQSKVLKRSKVIKSKVKSSWIT